MDQWELDFNWLRIRHFVKDSLGHANLPDMQAILMMIGVQELGRWRKDFTKEEKQDLMHIGTCEVLTEEGYYEFTHRDADGWPHYTSLRVVDIAGHKAQEHFLKQRIIKYFDKWEALDTSTQTPSNSAS